VPLAEYESMKETEYLLRDPSNAAALRRSIAELGGRCPGMTEG
jgi:antitoxin YefM